MESDKLSALDILVLAVIISLIVLNTLHAVAGLVVLAVVEGRSMLPMYRSGDIVIVISGTNINVGDVIIYRTCTGKLIIHRVVKILTANGTRYYVTKGDGNTWIDYHNFIDCTTLKPLPGIPEDRVIGKVLKVFGIEIKIPYLGLITIAFNRLLNSLTS